MSVHLEDSRHATQKRQRTKNRPQEWNDSVDKFYAMTQARTRLHHRCYREIGFGCRGEWQCFSLKLEDFVQVIKCMLAILPLKSLLELSNHIASLMTDEVEKAENMRIELSRSKADLQSKLSSVQRANWSLKSEIRHLERCVSELEEGAIDSNEIVAS